MLLNGPGYATTLFVLLQKDVSILQTCLHSCHQRKEKKNKILMALPQSNITFLEVGWRKSWFAHGCWTQLERWTWNLNVKLNDFSFLFIPVWNKLNNKTLFPNEFYKTSFKNATILLEFLFALSQSFLFFFFHLIFIFILLLLYIKFCTASHKKAFSMGLCFMLFYYILFLFLWLILLMQHRINKVSDLKKVFY